MTDEFTCKYCKKEIKGMAQHAVISTTVEDLVSIFETPLNNTQRYHIPCYGKKFKVKVPRRIKQ
jgi:hypothetical protein